MATGALGSALSGLQLAQQQLSVLSNNIANASTPGYTRKILPQNAQAINGEFVGVRAEILTRYVDTNLQRDLWTQVSVSGFSAVQEQYLSNVDEFHGNIDSGTNIAAKLTQLRDSFSSLSDNPSDTFLQERTLSAAKNTVSQINDFAKFVQNQRNDVVDDLDASIDQVNSLLSRIADFNAQTIGAANVGRSTAHVEDLRDSAIEELSSLIDISFFRRSDGAVVIQTRRGSLLADERAMSLHYNRKPVSELSYYPNNISAISLGDPSKTLNTPDITDELSTGGKIGGLIELRDQTFPEYSSQIDELAHKLALRFDEQGLRLFTDPNGLVPNNDDPDTVTSTPVSYVGFASRIEVNSSILADSSLIQAGTLTNRDQPVSTGSNEIIQRVLNFTFGEEELEVAQGARDIVSTIAPPNDNLQNWLGLSSKNSLLGAVDLTSYGAVDISEAPGSPFVNVVPPPGPPYANNDLNIRLFNGVDDTGLINIDLDAAAIAFPIGGAVTDAGEQVRLYLEAQVNAAIGATSISAVVSLTPSGQLKIDSNSNIQIDAGTMGQDGLDFLGLSAGTFNAEDPYISVQVGTNPVQKIIIDSDDTHLDLLDKMNFNGPIDPGGGVSGLYAVIDVATGQLMVRPGTDNTVSDDFTYGGALKITGGPFITQGAADAVTPDGVGIVEALFGVPDPITSTAHAAFKTEDLGPGLGRETKIKTATTLIGFSEKMINRQISDLQTVRATNKEEVLFKETLDTQFKNISGVNVEQELANLIVVQNAFAASAKMIGIIDELFDKLFQSI